MVWSSYLDTRVSISSPRTDSVRGFSHTQLGVRMILTDTRDDILTALDNAWASRQLRIVDGHSTHMIDEYIDTLLDRLAQAS